MIPSEKGFCVRIADPAKLPRILEAAGRLFAERSFSEVRMEDIAALAEVAKGTLYLHFKDKEHLFREMIAEVSRRRLDESQVRLDETQDPREKLRILVQDAIRFSDRYPHYLETLHHLDGNPPRSEDAAIQRGRERLFVLIEDILRQIDGSRELPVPDPARSAAALLGMMHRVMLWTPRPWPSDLSDWITSHFLYGVTGEPRSS